MIHLLSLCWFIDELETSTWAIQMHVLNHVEREDYDWNPVKFT